MSTIVNLMKYQLGVENRYLEDSGKCIESSFIGEESLNGLIRVAPLAKLTIYEEDGSDKSSEAECLQNQKISEALNFVKAEFIDLLAKTQLSSIRNTDEDLVKAMSELRSITNLYNLLKIKYAKYQSDDAVVVKLG